MLRGVGDAFAERLTELVEASLAGRDPGREGLARLLAAPDDRTLEIVADRKSVV